MPKLQTLKPTLQTINLAAMPMVAISRKASGSVGPSWRGGKQGSTARGYGYKWQQARIGWLRAHPLCVMCEGAGVVTSATVVDHIKAHRGDNELFWNSSNWQSLCKRHHDSHAQRRDNAS